MNPVRSKSVKHVCDACWEKHVELKRLSPEENQKLILAMSTEWLKLAPSDRRNRKFHPELSLADAARKCAIAAYTALGDGEGLLTWGPHEERFMFNHYNETLTPGHYDDVLLRKEYHSWSKYEGDWYVGSVRKVREDKILLIWESHGNFDDGR